jgi:hypothetical protein
VKSSLGLGFWEPPVAERAQRVAQTGVQRRQNATHQSTTDPEARLAKKGAGKEARLCYTESVRMENRNGIMIDLRVGQASGLAESEQGLEMLQELRGHQTRNKARIPLNAIL